MAGLKVQRKNVINSFTLPGVVRNPRTNTIWLLLFLTIGQQQPLAFFNGFYFWRQKPNAVWEKIKNNFFVKLRPHKWLFLQLILSDMIFKSIFYFRIFIPNIDRIPNSFINLYFSSYKFPDYYSRKITYVAFTCQILDTF